MAYRNSAKSSVIFFIINVEYVLPIVILSFVLKNIKYMVFFSIIQYFIIDVITYLGLKLIHIDKRGPC